MSKRTVYRRRTYQYGTDDLTTSSTAVKPNLAGYQSSSGLNTQVSQAPNQIEDYNQFDVSSFAGYAQGATPFLKDALNTNATPQTAEQKYINAQVQSQAPGSTYEDLSYNITNMNPIASVAHDVGAGIGDALAPTNEYGYSDSSNFSVALSGAFDPGRTTDQAMSSLESGDTLQGIGELLLPGYAAVNQNEAAKAQAAEAQQQYAANQVFNQNYNFANTNQYNQSRSGNTFQLRNGGSLSKSNGGAISKEFVDGTNGTIYNGPTHEGGGIPLGKETEVEGNEVRFGKYVFSDKLTYK